MTAKPSRSPKTIDADSWWYEDERGIRVVCAVGRPYTMRIPWSKILKAAKRCGRIK